MVPEPNWLIVALVGAVIGILIQISFQILQAVHKRFRKSYLEGTWYEYHTSFFDNTPTILSGTWRIRKGVLSPFSVDGNFLETIYKGKVKLDSGNIVINLTSNQAQENAIFIFKQPFPTNATKMLGIWLSIDNDKVIASGAIILVREKINNEDALALLRSSIKSDRSLPLLRLRK